MIYVTTTVKYWLIVSLFSTTTGELVERHEIRYKNEVACYQAMEAYPYAKNILLEAECVERNFQRAYK